VPPPTVISIPTHPLNVLAEIRAKVPLTLDDLRTTGTTKFATAIKMIRKSEIFASHLDVGLDRTSEEAKFILAMALCHTVVCETDSNGK
jgi:hypothetical protein